MIRVSPTGSVNLFQRHFKPARFPWKKQETYLCHQNCTLEKAADPFHVTGEQELLREIKYNWKWSCSPVFQQQNRGSLCVCVCHTPRNGSAMQRELFLQLLPQGDTKHGKFQPNRSEAGTTRQSLPMGEENSTTSGGATAETVLPTLESWHCTHSSHSHLEV